MNILNKGPSKWQIGKRPLIPAPPAPPPVPSLSQFSTPGVRDSIWCSMDFLLGAGMVIIQQNTHRIVVVYETKKKYWFFPRGRKDVGESLETTALREAYEESGYRVEFLPLRNPTRQPPPPEDPDADRRLNIEPITITLAAWQPKRGRQGERIDEGGEYLTSWYAGKIPEDAVREVGTGMSDEQNFESHLLTIEEAMARVWGHEKNVLRYVWAIYQETLKHLPQPSEGYVQGTLV